MAAAPEASGAGRLELRPAGSGIPVLAGTRLIRTAGADVEIEDLSSRQRVTGVLPAPGCSILPGASGYAPVSCPSSSSAAWSTSLLRMRDGTVTAIPGLGNPGPFRAGAMGRAWLRLIACGAAGSCRSAGEEVNWRTGAVRTERSAAVRDLDDPALRAVRCPGLRRWADYSRPWRLASIVKGGLVTRFDVRRCGRATPALAVRCPRTGCWSPTIADGVVAWIAGRRLDAFDLRTHRRFGARLAGYVPVSDPELSPTVQTAQRRVVVSVPSATASADPYVSYVARVPSG